MEEKERVERELVAQSAELWTAAAAEMEATRFNADSGKLEAVGKPQEPEKLQMYFMEKINRGEQIIKIPAALIDGGKLKQVAFDYWSFYRYDNCRCSMLSIPDDPVFKAPDGMPVYAALTAENGGCVGRYWVLSGDTLYMATGADGLPVYWMLGGLTEGYKAKQARLKAEAEAAELERKRLAKEEAERKEAERQEKQLEQLKAIPAAAFDKLMNIVKG